MIGAKMHSENETSKDRAKPIATYLPSLFFSAAILLGAIGLVLSVIMILTGSKDFGMYVGLALLPVSLMTSCLLIAIGSNIRYSQEVLLVQRNTSRILAELPEHMHHAIRDAVPDFETLLTDSGNQQPNLQITSMLTQLNHMSTQLHKLNQTSASNFSLTDLNSQDQITENISIDLSAGDQLNDFDQSQTLEIDQQIDSRIQHINDLMSIADFNSAMQAMTELQMQFPTSQKVQLMFERITTEADMFHSQQRKRFLELISEHGQARCWSSALEVAHKLIEKYPESIEAKETQAMLPTIIDNARIQDVREYRNRFVEMMQRKCYPQALEIAQYVTENYPETAAAEELRNQLPQIWELARRSQTGLK